MAPLPSIRLPFNSASLWASTKDDLQAIYDSPYTGALTTRTAVAANQGFPHDDSVHQYTFFSTFNHDPLPKLSPARVDTTHPKANPGREVSGISTLNTLGYSPFPLKYYIDAVRNVQAAHSGLHKPVIFSVAGSPASILECYAMIAKHHDPAVRVWEIWCLEINLSCPNILGATPPAYSASELKNLLMQISEGIKSRVMRAKFQLEKAGSSVDEVAKRLKSWNIPIGLKLPPYTYARQFNDLIEIIRSVNSKSGISSEPSPEIQQENETTFVSHQDLNGAKRPSQLDSFINQETIDPKVLSLGRESDIDSTLANDLAISLSLDDALSQVSYNEISGQNSQILSSPFPVSFLTATNTLGSCLHLSDTDGSESIDEDHGDYVATLNSSDSMGIGGMAGASLHPLALGNVKSLKSRLLRDEVTRPIQLIGVGGVGDSAGFKRMKSAGADAVALATALGIKGVAVFEDIATHV